MWTKQAEPEQPSTRPSQANSPAVSSTTFANPTTRTSTPVARSVSCLGASLEIKGKITGDEDLQIDGKVEGPISLSGQRLTIGHTGKLHSEISAREVIVYGDITGNLNVQDRVEIKKDSSVIGDIKASRISIEDGAYCKGRIEIDRGRPASAVSVAEPKSVDALVAAEAN
jgi:cytoskeletal protein CcmA (bactofilin family)